MVCPTGEEISKLLRLLFGSDPMVAPVFSIGMSSCGAGVPRMPLGSLRDFRSRLREIDTLVGSPEV
jgi:hypothetical protein